MFPSRTFHYELHTQVKIFPLSSPYHVCCIPRQSRPWYHHTLLGYPLVMMQFSPSTSSCLTLRSKRSPWIQVQNDYYYYYYYIIIICGSRHPYIYRLATVPVPLFPLFRPFRITKYRCPFYHVSKHCRVMPHNACIPRDIPWQLPCSGTVLKLQCVAWQDESLRINRKGLGRRRRDVTDVLSRILFGVYR